MEIKGTPQSVPTLLPGGRASQSVKERIKSGGRSLGYELFFRFEMSVKSAMR